MVGINVSGVYRQKKRKEQNNSDPISVMKETKPGELKGQKTLWGDSKEGCLPPNVKKKSRDKANYL